MFGALAASPVAAQDNSINDDDSFNDIIITASGRNDTIQNVPIAVTALDSTLLDNANITDVGGLEQLAPSLQVTTAQAVSTGTTLSIRGIGTGGENPGFEPAVGVFVDGVYRARSGLAMTELQELERVEVLRGPQGTLFGRNTSAGAISIFTMPPSFDSGGYVETGYGNYDAFTLKGGITGPVTDKVALRADGSYRRRDGYIHDANSDRVFNNLDRHALRLQALYQAEGFSARLIADYAKVDEQCCAAVSSDRGILAPIVDGIAAMRGLTGIYDGPPSDRVMATSPTRDLMEKVTDWGLSGELEWALDDMTLTSITGYRDWQVRRNQDVDFSGIDRAYREGYRTGLKDFTQEIRVRGSMFDDRIDWLVGGYFLKEKLSLTDRIHLGADASLYGDIVFKALSASADLPTGFQFFGTLPDTPLFGQVALAANPQLAAMARSNPALFNLFNSPIPGPGSGDGQRNDRYGVNTTAFAVFTHDIIKVTDALSLTLGLRYNYERKRLSADLDATHPTCSFFLDPGHAPYLAAYLSQPALAPAFPLLCNPTVNSEFNGRYSDRRSESEFTGTAKLSYAFSADVLGYASFDRGYKSGGYNLDRGTFDSVLVGGNGPQADDLEFGNESVDAYEIGVKSSFGENFTLNIAGFYQEFNDFQSLLFAGNNFVVQNVDSITSKGVEAEAWMRPAPDLTVRAAYSYISATYDKSNDLTGTPLEGLEGRQLAIQPRHVVTIATSYTPRLSERLKGLLHFDMRYNGQMLLEDDPISPQRNEAYAVVNGIAGITTADDRYRLELFAENIFKTRYFIAAFPVPEQFGNFAAYPSPPRFYGIRARARF